MSPQILENCNILSRHFSVVIIMPLVMDKKPPCTCFGVGFWLVLSFLAINTKDNSPSISIFKQNATRKILTSKTKETKHDFVYIQISKNYTPCHPWLSFLFWNIYRCIMLQKYSNLQRRWIDTLKMYLLLSRFNPYFVVWCKNLFIDISRYFGITFSNCIIDGIPKILAFY